MNDLMRVFTYENAEVRVVLKGTEPWAVLLDVCNVLEIKNSRMVFNRLDEDEKGVSISDTLGGSQEIQIINEFGLYHVLLTSRSEKAKPFRRWVTHEVLPAIREQGYYSVISDEQLVKMLIEKGKDPKKLRDIAVEAFTNTHRNNASEFLSITKVDIRNCSAALSDLEETRLYENRNQYTYQGYLRELSRIRAHDYTKERRHMNRYRADIQKLPQEPRPAR